jgi:hypothetical protein
MPARPPHHVPRLRYRLTRDDDLDECLSLMPAWLGLDDAVRQALPTLWRRMVREPAVLHMVMEDLALPRGERIQAWGVSLLVTPAEARALALDAAPAPQLAARVYRDIVDGRMTPHDDQTLGRHNARGELSMLILHFCARPLDLADPYAHAVIAVSNDSLRASLAGYCIDTVVFETHADDGPLVAAAGFLRRPRPPGHEAGGLHLWGMTRAESVRLLPGSTVRALFEAQPPRFRLSHSQRRMLWLAQFYEDEELLAAELQLSAHGLKKLWRGVYDRIQDMVPDFFGGAGPADDEGKRGPEKRRQVLAYVRQRPEELRPWSAA